MDGEQTKRSICDCCGNAHCPMQSGVVREHCWWFQPKKGVIKLKTLKIKLDSGAFMPTRAYPSDAGLDLYSMQDVTVWPMDNAVIDTGVHVQIPEGYFGQLTSKSGLMAKDNVTSTGTIDSSYRGSIKAVLFNHDQNKPFEVQRGQKVTQLVILPCETPALEVVDELDKTDRADNGFGSTGR